MGPHHSRVSTLLISWFSQKRNFLSLRSAASKRSVLRCSTNSTYSPCKYHRELVFTRKPPPRTLGPGSRWFSTAGRSEWFIRTAACHCRTDGASLSFRTEQFALPHVVIEGGLFPDAFLQAQKWHANHAVVRWLPFTPRLNLNN